MIIKTPKTHVPLFIAVIMLCLVLGLSLNKTRIKAEAFTVIDTVMAQDWGFASLTGLFGIASLREFGDTPVDVAMGLIKIFPERILARIPKIIGTKIAGFPDRPDLERIDIDINFKNYQKILGDRDRALKNTILTDPHEVSAKITYRGKKYKSKIRLKGDLVSHWRSRTRMSFRVSLKGKNTIRGFKRFSLHKPGDRQYPYDQIFQKMMSESGGLASAHDYVRVFVNGQKWGVMNIEEHMSKELLEKQEAKESIILKLTNERRWYYEKITPLPYEPYRLSNMALSTSVYQGGKYLSDPRFRSYYSYVAQKFETHEERDIFDVDSFSRSALGSTVWNAFHSLSTGNTRFYFNPYTLKIEPINADQDFFKKIEKESYELSDLYSLHIPAIYKETLFSQEGLRNFQKNLQAVIQAAEKIPEIYDYYHSFFPNNYPTDVSVVMSNLEVVRALEKQEIPTHFVPDIAPEVKDENKLPLPEKLPPTLEQAAGFFDHVHVRHYDDGRLLLFNLLDVSVRLEKVLYDGNALETFSDTIIPPYTENDGLLVIKTDKKGLHDGRFTAVTSYGGHKRKTKNEETLIANLSNPLEVIKGRALPDYIGRKDSGFVIETGRWDVKRSLLIDGNLTIKAGAELVFAPDAYLIVKGALVAKGTKKSPITFKPLKENWKGLYVMEAEKQSVLRYVVIKDTDALVDGLLSLTGGVTFYKSPVLIENTQIIGTIAEDALNIVKSDFVIKDSLIEDTRSDAFDGDFSSGKIISSRVEKVGGDALDFSGSNILIKNVTIKDTHDKAVSAGEKTILKIQDSTITNVGVGVASKDGSIVTADRITVIDYDLYAAMTYVKKDMFGASELYISQLTHNGDVPFSRQKKTKLFVDGSAIYAQKIDVKELYSSGVMRK